jgi:hypothetical protein
MIGYNQICRENKLYKKKHNLSHFYLFFIFFLL